MALYRGQEASGDLENPSHKEECGRVGKILEETREVHTLLHKARRLWNSVGPSREFQKSLVNTLYIEEV